MNWNSEIILIGIKISILIVSITMMTVIEFSKKIDIEKKAKYATLTRLFFIVLVACVSYIEKDAKALFFLLIVELLYNTCRFSDGKMIDRLLNTCQNQNELIERQKVDARMMLKNIEKLEKELENKNVK